jgi:hypothetical protein
MGFDKLCTGWKACATKTGSYIKLLVLNDYKVLSAEVQRILPLYQFSKRSFPGTAV